MNIMQRVLKDHGEQAALVIWKNTRQKQKVLHTATTDDIALPI